MNIFRFSLISFILSAVLYSEASGQGGPPMVTDDPSTVEKGHWENNLGFTLEHNSVVNVYEVPLEDLNYGLTEHLQLKMEIPFIINHVVGNGTVSGLGKLNFGVKWQFIQQEKAGVALGTYPQLSFNVTSNSSDKGLVDKGVEFFLPLAFQKKFSRSAAVIQIGRLFRTADSEEWFYGVLFNRELSKCFEVAAEMFGNLPADFSDNETFLNLGMRVKMNEHLRLLVSAGKNIMKSKENNNIFIAYVGVQINL